MSVDFQISTLTGDMVTKQTSPAIPAQPAKGTIDFIALPTSGDTVTVGNMTYTLVNSFTGSPAYQIKIVSSINQIQVQVFNLVLAVLGFPGAGTFYGVGTPVNPLFGSYVNPTPPINTFTAAVPGIAGNLIPLAASSSSVKLSGLFLSGGAEAIPAIGTIVEETGLGEVVQRVRIRLQKQLGEWRYNMESGVPWLPTATQAGILGSKNATEAAKSIISSVALATDGVTGVQIPYFAFNTTTRGYTLQMSLTTIYGTAPLTITGD